MTKEELIKENTVISEGNRKLSEIIKELDSKDSKLREEFSKAFDFIRRDCSYGECEDVVLTKSWEQIFCELGKLLNRKNTDKLEENVAHCLNWIREAELNFDTLFEYKRGKPQKTVKNSINNLK